MCRNLVNDVLGACTMIEAANEPNIHPWFATPYTRVVAEWIKPRVIGIWVLTNGLALIRRLLTDRFLVQTTRVNVSRDLVTYIPIQIRIPRSEPNWIA